jgi:hypothetical protein
VKCEEKGIVGAKSRMPDKIPHADKPKKKHKIKKEQPKKKDETENMDESKEKYETKEKYEIKNKNNPKKDETENREKELDALIKSWIPGENVTENGVICPFCQIPQKQINSHMRKKHEKEVMEVSNSQECQMFFDQLKKYIHKISQQKYSNRKREENPEAFKERDKENTAKYRTNKKDLDPEVFARKQSEYMNRRKDMNKQKVKEDEERWNRQRIVKNKTWEACRRRFHEENMYGPIFTCVCCHRMLFRKHMVEVTPKLVMNIRVKAKAAKERRAPQGQHGNQERTEEEEAMSKLNLEENQDEDEKDNGKDESYEEEPSSDEENDEGYLNFYPAYRRWQKRHNRIINILSNCCDLIQPGPMLKILMKCGGYLCDEETFKEKCWFNRWDELVDSEEKWTDDIVEELKDMEKNLDKAKEHQLWEEKILKNIQKLLKEDENTKLRPEKKQLLSMMITRFDKQLDGRGKDVWSTTGIPDCTCKVRINK